MLKSVFSVIALLFSFDSYSQTEEKELIIDGLIVSYYCKSLQYSEMESYLTDRGYELDHHPNTKRIYVNEKEQTMLLILGYEWVEITSTAQDINQLKSNLNTHLHQEPFVKQDETFVLSLPKYAEVGYSTVLTWEGENNTILTFSPPEIHNETKSWENALQEVFE